MVLVIALVIGGVWYGYQYITSESIVEKQSRSADFATNPSGSRPPLDFQNIVYTDTSAEQQRNAVYARSFTDPAPETLMSLPEGAPVFNWYNQKRSDFVSSRYQFVLGESQEQPRKELWVGENGQSPESVYETSGGNEIFNPVLSRDGTQVTFAVVNASDGYGSNVSIYQLNTASGETTQVYNGDRANTSRWWTPLKWIPNHNRLFMSNGSIDPTAYSLLNTRTGDSATVVEDRHSLRGFAASADGDKSAYVRATKDRNRPGSNALPHYIGEPYTVYVQDTATNQKTEVATSEQHVFNIEWVENREILQLAYTDNKTIRFYEPATGTDTETYMHSGHEITELYAISDTEAIIQTDNPNENATGSIIYVNLKEDETTRIMDTTHTTNILSVTGELSGE